jgi:hypothetical protein
LIGSQESVRRNEREVTSHPSTAEAIHKKYEILQISMYLGGFTKLWKSWTTGEVRIQPIVIMLRDIALNHMEECKI